MRFLPALLAAPILLLPAVRKGGTALRVSLSGAENQRFVITVQGLRVLNSNELYLAAGWRAGRRVREQDTLSAPAVLDISGVGAVDLSPLDTNTSVTTEILTMPDTLKARVIGHRVRVEHSAIGAPFTAFATQLYSQRPRSP